MIQIIEKGKKNCRVGTVDWIDADLNESLKSIVKKEGGVYADEMIGEIWHTSPERGLLLWNFNSKLLKLLNQTSLFHSKFNNMLLDNKSDFPFYADFKCNWVMQQNIDPDQIIMAEKKQERSCQSPDSVSNWDDKAGPRKEQFMQD